MAMELWDNDCMTKADYIQLAAALREQRPEDTGFIYAQRGTWEACCVAVANVCVRRHRGTSTTFNRAKFLAACGVID